MGQQISALVDTFSNDAEKERLANDALHSLMELADTQMKAFRLTISNPDFDAKRIPIKKVIKDEYILRANVTTSPDDIGKVISDSFSTFASGDVANGIAKLVHHGLEVLLGSFSANSATKQTYCISSGSLGGVFRIDLYFYAYRFTSSQLKDISKQVLAVSVVVSSADLKEIDDNTLRSIVQLTYGSSPPEEQQKIYDQITEAMKKSQPPTANALNALRKSDSTADTFLSAASVF